MAIYKGTTTEILDGPALDERPWISVNLETGWDSQYDPFIEAVQTSESGRRTYNIFDPLLHLIDGKLNDYPTFLYGRWIVEQNAEFLAGYTIPLGVVAAKDQVVYQLWNAFDYKPTVTSITVDPDPNLSFGIDGLDVGTPILPYSETNVTFTILGTAPPLFSVEVTVGFDIGPDLVLTVEGQVGVLMPFRPQSKVTEKLDFKTNIITARNGLEQRLSYRKHPRQAFVYKYEFADEHINMVLRNNIEAQAGSAYLVPVWAEQRPALPIDALDLTISCSTEFADFRIGGSVFIYQDDYTFETAAIVTITPTELTVSLPLKKSYVRPVVMPLDACWSNNRLKGNQVANGPVEYTVEFRVIDNVSLTPPTFPVEYNGVPVITDGGWFSGRSQRRTTDAGTFSLDNKSGVFSMIRKWNIPKNSFEYGYHAQTQEQVWDVRRFLHFLNGMQKTVWMPSMDNDFTQTQTTVTGAGTITVRNDSYTQTWGTRNYTDHIAIYDGTNFFFREIIETTELSETEELLTLDSGFGTGYNPGELKIMRMPLVRLLSEKLKLKWSRAGQADIPLTFVEVQR